MRIIVIGSGIAGLSAALGLRKVGIEVTLYERAPELREVGAGISLWANAIRALDYFGVGDAVRAIALSLDQSEFRADEGRRLQARFSGKDLEKKTGVSPSIAMVHRAELVGVLAGFLPGVARYGFECVGVEQRSDRVMVRFANGQADEADGRYTACALFCVSAFQRIGRQQHNRAEREDEAHSHPSPHLFADFGREMLL